MLHGTQAGIPGVVRLAGNPPSRLTRPRTKLRATRWEEHRSPTDPPNAEGSAPGASVVAGASSSQGNAGQTYVRTGTASDALPPDSQDTLWQAKRTSNDGDKDMQAVDLVAYGFDERPATKATHVHILRYDRTMRQETAVNEPDEARKACRLEAEYSRQISAGGQRGT